VFVKTFELQTNTSDPTSLLRLETRLLVRDTNGAVYGVTYKWRSDYSDADLLSTSQTQAVQIHTPNRLLNKGAFWECFVSCRFFHKLARPVKPSRFFGFF
jgi:hypothetical protein